MTTPKTYKFTPISNAQFNTPQQLPTQNNCSNNYVTFIKPSLYIPKKGRVEEKIALIYHFMKDNEAITDTQSSILQNYFQLYQTLQNENEKNYYFNEALILLRNINNDSKVIDKRDKKRIELELWSHNIPNVFKITVERQREIINCFQRHQHNYGPIAATNPYHPSFKYTTVRIPTKAQTIKINESLLIQPQQPQFIKNQKQPDLIPLAKMYSQPQFKPISNAQFTPISNAQFNTPQQLPKAATAPKFIPISQNYCFKHQFPELMKPLEQFLYPEQLATIQGSKPEPKPKSICDLAIEKGAVEEK